jgi:hypothetical protein
VNLIAHFSDEFQRWDAISGRRFSDHYFFQSSKHVSVSTSPSEADAVIREERQVVTAMHDGGDDLILFTGSHKVVVTILTAGVSLGFASTNPISSML